MTQEHIYIIAPNWQLFRHYCAKHNLSPRLTHFIDRPEKLLSLDRGLVHHLIGDQHGDFSVSSARRRELIQMGEILDTRPRVSVRYIYMKDHPSKSDLA